jgi:hypothetical protein
MPCFEPRSRTSRARAKKRPRNRGAFAARMMTAAQRRLRRATNPPNPTSANAPGAGTAWIV